MKEKKTMAYLAAVSYALIIGLSFLFTKIALQSASPFDILAHRFTISFAVLTVFVALGKIKLNITRKDILSILPLSIFYPTLFFAFQSFGLQYISSSEAGIIQSTIPVFTAILASIFLKERTTNLQKGAILLSVAGVIYIFWNKGIALDSNSSLGIILLLLCALSSACYNVLARKKTQQYQVIDLTYMMITVGFICFNVLLLIQRGTSGILGGYFSAFKSTSFLGAILYLGILSSIGSSFLSTYALSQIDASKMSVFNNLGTVITVFAGVVFLKEELYYYHIIGAIAIVLGIIGTNLQKDKK